MHTRIFVMTMTHVEQRLRSYDQVHGENIKMTMILNPFKYRNKVGEGK